MKKLLFLLGLFISLSGYSQVYLYSDGNSNIYWISPDNIKYGPVKKENSSSGEYSGGNEKTVSITQKEYSELSRMFEDGIAAKSQQNSKREMGTGMIRRNDKRGTEVILNMNSKVKEAIEKKLKVLLKN